MKRIAVFIVVIMLPVSAWAYLQFTSDTYTKANGQPYFMRWKSSPIYVMDAGVLGNLSNASADTQATAVVGDWNTALGGIITISLDTTNTDDFGVSGFPACGISPAMSWLQSTDVDGDNRLEMDGVNEIVLDNTGDVLRCLGVDPTNVGGSQVLGVGTGCGYFWSCEDAGGTPSADPEDIEDATIILNGCAFGGGGGSCGVSAGVCNNDATCLRSVLLHEFGHTLGFGHSLVGRTNSGASTAGSFFPVTSTSEIAIMFPFSTGEIALEADDLGGTRVIYGSAVPPTGSIRGQVLNGFTGQPARGLHIRAVPVGSPTSDQIGAFSDFEGKGNGEFAITGLANGNYYLIVEDVDGRLSLTGGNFGGIAGNPAQQVQDKTHDNFPTQTAAVASSQQITVSGGGTTTLSSPVILDPITAIISGGCSFMASATNSPLNTFASLILLLLPLLAIVILKRQFKK